MRITLFFLTLCLWGCNTFDPQKIKTNFKKGELEYFSLISFGSEFNSKQTNKIIFWKRNLRIKLHGEYEKSDSLELLKIVEELNNLINNIQLKIVKNLPNVDIYFKNQFDFHELGRETYGNKGVFFVDMSLFFPKALIIIDKNQKKINRNHLLREELTQTLGLMKDSWQYPESIFYEGWTSVTEFSEIDKKMIQLLYNYDLPYYMSEAEFKNIFLK